MIISVQRQFLLAAAIVLSLTVTQSPSAAFGQSTNNTPPTAVTADSNQAAAQQLLLKARQALARGDVDSANARLQAARQMKVDFQKIGDSPATVESMIQQQSELVDLANARDASYDSGAAAFLLIQAEAMIYYQDFETAEMLISQAKMFPVEFTPAIGNPEKLTQMLATAKQSAAMNSTGTVATAKSEVLKLLSQAQLAMDRENWTAAKSYVEQAKKQNVPDSQFAANEPRPWQLELKIQNALNRQSFAGSNLSGNQTARSNTQAFDPAVMQTSFNEHPASPNQAANSVASAAQVVQAGYDPASDLTENIQVTANAEMEATPAIDVNDVDRIPTSGLDFYNSGLKALTVNDQAAAIAYFQKAWENRQDLDGKTRQAIKDQIERLVPGGAETILKATLASQQTDIDINEIKADQRTAFNKLQTDVFKERTAAERLLKTKPREALEKMSMIRGRIAQSSLDGDSQRPLLAIVDRDINEMQKYIEQNLPDIMNDEQNATNLDKVDRDRQRKLDVEQQLQKLVDDYNRLIDEKRFAEAGVVVNQASDLAPDSELVVLLREKHRIHSNLDRAMAIKAMKERGFVDSLASVEKSTIPWDYSHDVEFGDDLEKYTANARRRDAARNANRYNSPAEERIWNTLKTQQVQGEYRGTLSEAVNQLSQQAGVNIIFDDLALTAEGIKKDTQIDVPINNPISLNSALDVILGNAGLVFVVESEVIKITSKEARNNNLVTKTYYIGDLVMPMNQNPNPLQLNYQYPGMAQPGMQRGMNGSFNAVDSATMPTSATSQLAMAQQMAGNNMPGNPFNALALGGYGGGNGGPQTGIPITQKLGGQGFGGVTMQDFFPLIQLVQNTIQTDTWQQTGGVGTIQPYAANLSLIVSQTQEIQDEIQDLLKKLRELNDVQIVIEVRFITLSDSFFERIGIDFDFNINDNSGLTPIQATQDNRASGSSVVGRDPQDGAGFVPTGDLDLQFLQGSFGAAQTTIGGFNAASAGSFGFAILSDIEVFFLIQASKGDRRSSIMQAPTVTMFNGQSANVSDGASRPFVTSVIPVVGDFAVAHQPVITILPDGTNLDVQAVVSDDRRFVRLNLVPFFSQVTDVETFTFDGSTTTQRSTNSVLDDLLDAVNPANADASDDELETVKTGITIQLPVLSFTTVNTVVSVPDGGTVLMGGIKRMSEARAENGIPFLSNIPYVNRLFKNTAIGHETSNLMMMVTPRIIIQKEIEEDQVGLIGE